MGRIAGILIASLTAAASCYSPSQANATLRAQPTRLPPDASTPAAGFCTPEHGRLAKISVDRDVPDPRCLILRGGQGLLVRNTLHRPVTIRWAQRTSHIAADTAETFSTPANRYLQPGDHKLCVSAYAGCGVDVLVQSHSGRQGKASDGPAAG